ncbi:MAG: hypothetical protein AAB371_03215 [Patescibacteria group bacterium]
MKKEIIISIVFFIVFSITFTYFAPKINMKAQVSSGINISLSVYNGSRNLGTTLIQVGSPTKPANEFDAPYNIAVSDDTDYKIIINGLSPSIESSLKEQRIDIASQPILSNDFSNLQNSITIDGTFFSPTNDYELWKIWAEQGINKSNEIYFYLTKNDIAKNPSGLSNQYNIEFNPPEITSQATTISSNLTASWNKAYCLNNIEAGTISTDFNRTEKITGLASYLSESDFLDFIESISLPFDILTHNTEETYTAKVENISNSTTLTVKPYTISPPPQSECSDGIDNDQDDLIDLADPDCSDSSDNSEATDIIIIPPPPDSTYKYDCYFGFYREIKYTGSASAQTIITSCNYARDSELCLEQIPEPCSIQIHE